LRTVLVGRLRENILTQDARIRVQVDQRAVVLGGEVDSPITKRVAGDDAWDTPGVVDVSNQLVVSGPS
jgi:osmotically-inducible protein OsmY